MSRHTTVIYTCDRPGCNERIHNVSGFIRFGAGLDERWESAGSAKESADLCPGCQAELLEFWNEKNR